VDADDSHAFVFTSDSSLTYVHGDQAFTQALVREEDERKK